MNLQKNFHENWERISQDLPLQSKLVVAVSGGVDSTVLLHLLLNRYPAHLLVVAHFDHCVRDHSKNDAQFVKALCKKWGISAFFKGKRKLKNISEEALRNERYRFLEEVRKKTGAKAIVLGHHAQDQLETFLMRLIRGTGVEGLASMEDQNGVFLRPLLSVTKAELEHYAKTYGFEYCEDETNQDKRYFRNKIRHELIPVLLKLTHDFGGEDKFLKRFNQLTRELAAVKNQNNQEAEKWVFHHLKKTKFHWSFSRQEWILLSPGVQKAVAIFLWDKLAKDTLETKEIQQLRESIRKNKKTVLSGGVRVVTSCEQVFLEAPQQVKEQLKIKKKKNLIDVLSKPGSENKLNRLLKSSNAELRFLEPGDRYGSQKMKRECLEQRIASPLRPLLPVVSKKGTHSILWYYSQPGDFADFVRAPWVLS